MNSEPGRDEVLPDIVCQMRRGILVIEVLPANPKKSYESSGERLMARRPRFESNLRKTA